MTVHTAIDVSPLVRKIRGEVIQALEEPVRNVRNSACIAQGLIEAAINDGADIDDTLVFAVDEAARYADALLDALNVETDIFIGPQFLAEVPV